MVAVGVEDVCHLAVILRLVHDNSGIALASLKDLDAWTCLGAVI